MESEEWDTGSGSDWRTASDRPGSEWDTEEEDENNLVTNQSSPADCIELDWNSVEEDEWDPAKSHGREIEGHRINSGSEWDTEGDEVGNNPTRTLSSSPADCIDMDWSSASEQVCFTFYFILKKLTLKSGSDWGTASDDSEWDTIEEVKEDENIPEATQSSSPADCIDLDWSSAEEDDSDWDSAKSDSAERREIDEQSMAGSIADSICKILALCPDESVRIRAKAIADASSLEDLALKIQAKLNRFPYIRL